MWKFALAMPLLLVAACAQTYGPAGTFSRTLIGGGYRDRQIDNQSWEVEYSGVNDYNFVYDAAVRRSAEIAKREGFPYFTVAKVGDDRVSNYSGNRYLGISFFIKLRMQVWRTYEERCQSNKIVRTTTACDLYETERTLASSRN